MLIWIILIQAAVETIAKYLQNIIENPIEAKYRRLRITNKAFQVFVLLFFFGYL